MAFRLIAAVMVALALTPAAMAMFDCNSNFVPGSSINYRYDVSALTRPTNSPYTVTDESGHTYDINVCGQVSCPRMHLEGGIKVSGCQSWEDSVQHQRALGRYSTMDVSESVAGAGTGYTIQYSDGDACTGANRTTLIEVVCTPGQVEPELVYLGESVSTHCLYQFALYADTGACPIITDYTTKAPIGPKGPSVCQSDFYTPSGDYYYPVQELRASYNAAYATVAPGESPTNSDEYLFEVNICGAVECGSSISSASPGACQQYTSSDGMTHYKELGRLDTASIEFGESLYDGFQITYEDGEKCSDGTARTTLINVECTPGLAYPSLHFVDETSHCVYEFTLQADRGACPIPTNPPEPQCGEDTWTTDDGRFAYAIADAAQDGPYMVEADIDDDGDNDYIFSISICDEVECPGMHLPAGTKVAGCQTWTDDSGNSHARAIGQLDQATITEGVEGDSSGYTIMYDGGDQCSSGKARSSIVYVLCSGGSPELIFDGEASCEYQFTLYTPDACPWETGVSTASPTSSSSGMSGGAVAIIVILTVLVVASAVIFGVMTVKRRNSDGLGSINASSGSSDGGCFSKCGSCCSRSDGFAPMSATSAY